WERISLSSGIQQVLLRAERIEFLTSRRTTFWDLETVECSPAIHQLVETLSSRLGPTAVLRPYLRDDDLPELAFGLVPAVGDTAQQDSLGIASRPPGIHRSRPLWLKKEPMAIDVIARHRHGPPVRFRWQNQDWSIHTFWGPERVTTAWWRGPLIRRDYYQ